MQQLLIRRTGRRQRLQLLLPPRNLIRKGRNGLLLRRLLLTVRLHRFLQARDLTIDLIQQLVILILSLNLDDFLFLCFGFRLLLFFLIQFLRKIRKGCLFFFFPDFRTVESFFCLLFFFRLRQRSRICFHFLFQRSQIRFQFRSCVPILFQQGSKQVQYFGRQHLSILRLFHIQAEYIIRIAENPVDILADAQLHIAALFIQIQGLIFQCILQPIIETGVEDLTENADPRCSICQEKLQEIPLGNHDNL